MLANKPLKPLFFALLKILADGQFHPTARLARQFFVSPATIQSTLRQMANYGLTLKQVRIKGNQLQTVPQLLIADKIEMLQKVKNVFEIIVLDQVSSTNTELLQYASTLPHGRVLVAELQTAGRGRMGRTWQMELGKSLTFSLLWHFDRGVSALAGLSLLIGLSLLQVLRGLGGREIQLKWPNDLVSPRGKLGGILLETRNTQAQSCQVVIGIGLNVAAFTQTTSEPAQTHLQQELDKLPERNQLLALLLDHLAIRLKQFAETGFAPFVAEWQAAHRDQQHAVELRFADGQTVSGVALGVSAQGGLLLETINGLQEFQTGDISLRKVNDG